MIDVLERHRVEWVHDMGVVVANIVCDAGLDAQCRRCDEACGHGEPYDEHVDCLAARDIMVTGATYLYCGERTDVHNGPIHLAWDGANWAWWYAGDEHADLEPAPTLQVVDVISDLSVVDVIVSP